MMPLRRLAMTLCWIAAACLCGPGMAQTTDAAKPPIAVDVRRAYQYALAHNTELAAARQQRGIASAGLVQARTYPFNPYLTITPRGVNGNSVQGVFSSFSFAAAATLELEVFGQRSKRIQVAETSLSRTECEIAAQELIVAARAVRAFNAVIYREEKLRLLDETVRLSQQAIEDLKDAAKKKKEKVAAGEMVLAQFEVQEAKAQLVGGRAPLIAARNDLRRVLGAAEEFALKGSLEITVRHFKEAELVTAALEARPDLHVKRLAVREAEARLRLERAGRLGNVTIGPNFELNEARTEFIGASVGMPIPSLNRKKGEILLREAELARTVADQHHLESEMRQDLKSALARLNEVQELIRVYRKEYLPALQARLHDLEKLYNQGGEGVDLQQVLELRRRVLKTRDAYLDALFDHGQIEVDLAVAVGDLELALDP